MILKNGWKQVETQRLRAKKIQSLSFSRLAHEADDTFTNNGQNDAVLLVCNKGFQKHNKRCKKFERDIVGHKNFMKQKVKNNRSQMHTCFVKS